MPRSGEGRSIRIDPGVCEALLALKRRNMIFSEVIAQMFHDCFKWSEDYSSNKSDHADFVGINARQPHEGRFVTDFCPLIQKFPYRME